MTKSDEANAEIACSLTPDELRARREYAREALFPHITSARRSGLSVTIEFDSAVGDRVHEFVELERLC